MSTPEVVILDGDGNAVPDRPPRGPRRTYVWGAVAIAAALFFVLGVMVGVRRSEQLPPLPVPALDAIVIRPAG